MNIRIGNEVHECQTEGLELQFHGFHGFIQCPNPILVCSMREFKSLDIFSEDPILPRMLGIASAILITLWFCVIGLLFLLIAICQRTLKTQFATELSPESQDPLLNPENHRINHQN
jgi:hypothetical protein